jgi:hypothetical protein
VRRLREEHRRIEQALVLLTSLLAIGQVDEELVARVAAEVAAQLSAEEKELYPLLERARSRPLEDLRALGDRTHALAASASRANPGESRDSNVKALHLAFREHARLVEREALPWLESALSTDSLDRLAQRVADVRAGMLADPKA